MAFLFLLFCISTNILLSIFFYRFNYVTRTIPRSIINGRGNAITTSTNIFPPFECWLYSFTKPIDNNLVAGFIHIRPGRKALRNRYEKFKFSTQDNISTRSQQEKHLSNKLNELKDEYYKKEREKNNKCGLNLKLSKKLKRYLWKTKDYYPVSTNTKSQVTTSTFKPNSICLFSTCRNFFFTISANMCRESAVSIRDWVDHHLGIGADHVVISYDFRRRRRIELTHEEKNNLVIYKVPPNPKLTTFIILGIHTPASHLKCLLYSSFSSSRNL